MMRTPGAASEGVRLAAAIWLAAAGGCFTPSYENCSVACTSDEDCAPGQACGAAGMCTASDDAMACGGAAMPDAPPVSSAGMYNLALTNQENGCAFSNWIVEATSNASVTISATESQIVAEATGSMGMLLDGWLGNRRFTGPHQGAQLDLVLMGFKTSSKTGCLYTFDLTLEAALDGDLLDGNMYYRARTNGGSGCGLLNGCVSRQTLRGERSPQ